MLLSYILYLFYVIDVFLSYRMSLMFSYRTECLLCCLIVQNVFDVFLLYRMSLMLSYRTECLCLILLNGGVLNFLMPFYYLDFIVDLLIFLPYMWEY